MVASTWPEVTLSPGATSTAVTVPDAPKLSSSTVDEATEPEMLTLLTTVPVVAVAVTRGVAVVPNGFRTQTAATAMTSRATGTISQRRHRRRPVG